MIVGKYQLIKESYKGILFLCVSVAAGLAMYLTPPEGLSEAGYRAIIVFIVCAVFWVTQVLPLAITSLLAIVLLPLLGILDEATAYSLFGNKAVFFILGAFVISTGLVTSGLSERTALWVLRKTGGKPKRLLAGVYFLCVTAAFIMPEHAVAAIMIPLVLQVAQWLELKPKQTTFGKALILAVVWGSLIGGVATFLGGARNILAVAILEENTGLTIGFTQWATAILPISVGLAIACFFLLLKLFPIDIEGTSGIQEKLEEKKQQLGKWTDDEITMLAIMAGTVLAWITIGEHVGIANIALVSAVILFLFRVVKWHHVEQHINWGVILMYGGAIALGVALEKTGAAIYVTERLVEAAPVSVWIVLLVLIVVTLLFTEVMSNSAVVAMLMPVALSIALTMGINPVAMTYMIAVAAGLAFMMPMGSPPNALGYATQFYSLHDAMRSGIVANVVALIIMLLGIVLWWPIIGVKLFI